MERKELPIGYYDTVQEKWYKWIELEELDSEDLMVLGRKKTQSNPYQIFSSLLQKGVIRVTNDDEKELANPTKKVGNFFFPDAIFSVIELVILTKGTSRVTTSYKCPKCQEFTNYDFDEDEDDESEIDNREDIRSVKLSVLSREQLKSNYFEYTVEKGFECSDGHFTQYNVGYPKLKTYIDVYNFTDNPLEQERETLYRSLVSMNGVDNKELLKIKTKYGRRFFLPKTAEYNKLTKKMRRIGYHLDEHKRTCRLCSHQYISKFDISNFFGSILPT